MVYGKLKNENEKTFNESTKSLQEIKSNLTRIQDDLKFCKMENENISTLVSIQYQEMNSFKNKEYGRPMLGTNASTIEMLGTMQDECKWVDQELAGAKKEIFNAKKFVKLNFTVLIPSLNSTSSAIWNDNNTIVEILQKVHSKWEEKNLALKKSLENYKRNLSDTEVNLENCIRDNDFINSSLVTFYNEEADSSRINNEIMASNIANIGTKDMLNNMLQYCTKNGEKLTLAYNETKLAKEFINYNFANFTPSSSPSELPAPEYLVFGATIPARRKSTKADPSI
jgi:hypothetical protein